MSWKYLTFFHEKKRVVDAFPYIPQNLKQVCTDTNEVSNDGWKRLTLGQLVDSPETLKNAYKSLLRRRR